MNPQHPLRWEPMIPEDLDEIMSIELSSFPSPWSREIFLKEMQNRCARTVVLKEGDRIVGYACFWEVLDEAHIQTIAVHCERRGIGYGKLIMQHVETRCLQDGLKRIILEVGRRNRVARNLYKRSGFKSIGFRKRYYTKINDDAVVMEKWLSSDQVKSEAATEADQAQ